MYHMIIGQYYYSKNEEGNFEATAGIASFLSNYSKKVYSSLNKILSNCKINVDLTKEDEFLLSEVTLILKSRLEELNDDEPIYISLEDFLSNEQLYTNLDQIQMSFHSQIDPKFTTSEVSKIIELLQKSVRQDIVTLLKEEKNISLQII